jgi:SAM-dependent methyltransferase
MDTREVGRYWESNARAWSTLSRQGWDVYRDALNTPAFLALLPEIGGRSGLDIGCGDGHNTRLLAARGARMAGVDLAPTFIEYAREAKRENPLGIQYSIGSAQDLPFASKRFDFGTAFMSLMDMPGPDAALREAWRVLRPGGFLQFSLTHPCFFPPHRRQLRNEPGEPYAVELGRYFDRIDGEIDRWTFSAAPPEMRRAYLPFEIPRFHRTLSEWLNLVVDVASRSSGSPNRTRTKKRPGAFRMLPTHASSRTTSTCDAGRLLRWRPSARHRALVRAFVSCYACGSSSEERSVLASRYSALRASVVDESRQGRMERRTRSGRDPDTTRARHRAHTRS